MFEKYLEQCRVLSKCLLNVFARRLDIPAPMFCLFRVQERTDLNFYFFCITPTLSLLLHWAPRLSI